MRYQMKGGFIRGEEKYPGNNPKNDTVYFKGSPGEIVLDKETISRGPKAWVNFTMSELEKHKPELMQMFKDHFDEGGTVSLPTNAPPDSNDNYSKLQNYFNPPAPAPAPVAPAVTKTPQQRIKELETIRTNLRPLNPSEQADYNRQKALAADTGMAEGGIVPEPSMAHGGKIDSSITPENAFNLYIPDQGIVGGTVYDGSTDEKFLFGDYCFDIEKAREISNKKSNAEIPVSDDWIDKIKLDPKEALKSKSKNPVFIAQIHTPNGMKPLLIDGNHRMFKAAWEGEKSIPAYVFSPEETSSLFCSKPDHMEHPKFGSINNDQKLWCGGNVKGYYQGGMVKGYSEGGTTGWDSTPPTSQELAAKTNSWDAAPPSDKELGVQQQAPSFGEGLVRGALKTLPTVGAIGAGILATPESAGLATIPAAAMGAAAGKSLENTIEQSLYGEGPKSTSEALKGIGEEAIGGAAGEIGGQAIGKAAELAAPYVKNLAAKAGETLTGIPKKVIETYAKHADEIGQMANSADDSVAEAADQMRQGFHDTIQATRQKLNSQISSALGESDKTVPMDSTISALQAAKDKMKPDINSKDIAQIDDLVGKLNGRSTDGQMSVQDAHEMKQYMQGIVSDSYMKPGEIFTSGSGADRAIKSAASNLRQIVNEAEPKIAEANNSLSKLHDIDDLMNSNLIAPGKPEAALLAAGSGANPRNVKNLEQIGELTGTDMKAQAEKLAAMRTFGNPAWTPVDTTGKTATRMGLGAGAGALIGHASGLPFGIEGGAAAGAAMTSPAMMKAAIDAGRRIPGQYIPAALQRTGQALIQKKLSDYGGKP